MKRTEKTARCSEKKVAAKNNRNKDSAIKNDLVNPPEISVLPIIFKEELFLSDSYDTEEERASTEHSYCSYGDPNDPKSSRSSESESDSEKHNIFEDEIEIYKSKEQLHKMLAIVSKQKASNLKISQILSAAPQKSLQAKELKAAPSKIVQVVHPRIIKSPKKPPEVANMLSPDSSTDFGKSTIKSNLKLHEDDKVYKQLSQMMGEFEDPIQQTKEIPKTLEPVSNKMCQIYGNLNEQERKFLEESELELASIFDMTDFTSSEDEDILEVEAGSLEIKEIEDILPKENLVVEIQIDPNSKEQEINKIIDSHKMDEKSSNRSDTGCSDRGHSKKYEKDIKAERNSSATYSNKMPLKLEINEDPVNNDLDLRKILIQKAKTKLAMIKVDKLQSKIAILKNVPESHAFSKIPRSSSPSKLSKERYLEQEHRDLTRKNSTDISNHTYEDEKSRPRNSNKNKKYPEVRKKKSNLVDPYCRRASPNESPRSPEKRESSMNLRTCGDLEMCEADTFKERERSQMKQTEKVVVKHPDRRNYSNQNVETSLDRLPKRNSSLEQILWKLIPIDLIDRQRNPSIDRYSLNSKDPRSRSTLVDHHILPDIVHPVISTRDPRLASRLYATSSKSVPETSNLLRPTELVESNSSHTTERSNCADLNDSLRKLKSIDVLFDEAEKSQLLPSTILEVLRNVSASANLSSNSEAHILSTSKANSVNKPKKRVMEDNVPKSQTVVEDKKECQIDPLKKNPVIPSSTVSPGSFFKKIFDIAKKTANTSKTQLSSPVPSFKSSFAPVPPPIMSALPPQRLSPLPILGLPLKRKYPDFGSDPTVSHKHKVPKNNKPDFYSVYVTKPKHITNKKGSTGIPITLQANFFRIGKEPDWAINQYSVAFEPPVSDVKVKKTLMRQHCSFLGGSLFDGTTIYVIKKLPLDILNMPTKMNDSKEIIKITLKYEKVIHLLESTSFEILNKIMRKTLQGLKMQRIGRNLFDAAVPTDLVGHKISLWPGFRSSIRQYENEILINSDVAHQVLRAETVYELFIFARREAKTFNYKDDFMKLVADTLVLTDYNNKTYKIDDIDFDSNPETLFQTKNGMISFVNYYKTRYNIDIKDLKQPLLISKTSKILENGKEEKISLIPELCRSTGLTEKHKVNLPLMEQLSDITRLGPIDRINRLVSFNKKINDTKECLDVLQNWKLKLDNELVEIKGRQLPQETIMFGKSLEFKNSKGNDWHSQMLTTEMFEQVHLLRWCVVYPEQFCQETEVFIAVLLQQCRAMNYQIAEPFFRKMVPNDLINTYMYALDDIISNNPQLIMLIVPNGCPERYAAIKTKCCVYNAIPTQVIQAKTLIPGNGSLNIIANKIAIQMNCKLGGAPWMINLPLTGLMTIGISCSRDTKDKKRSYAALIASMDLTISRKYFSCVCPYANNEELTNEITNSMESAIRAWHSEHGNLPQRILLYRENSNAQLEYVHRFEVKMVLQKLKAIYSEFKVLSNPRMSFIIVNRETKTKLFHNLSNPKPGTIVDDVITLPERYDFFLVSSKTSRKETISPTSYNIIHDQCGLAPDRIQLLSYKMCHLYYNWSGSVQKPAVCQYAQKLSSLVAKHLHRPPSNQFGKQLYFL